MTQEDQSENPLALFFAVPIVLGGMSKLKTLENLVDRFLQELQSEHSFESGIAQNYGFENRVKSLFWEMWPSVLNFSSTSDSV